MMRDLIESQNQIIQEDLVLIAEHFKKTSNLLENKAILITGATGLIGRYLALSVLTMVRLNKLNCQVIAQGRSFEKLKTTFRDVLDNANLVLWPADLVMPLNPPCKIDYVIHAASPTSSRDFLEKPIEVIDAIYQSTLNILNLCESHKVDSGVYLSSMEMYGQITKDVPVLETDYGYLDHLAPRSSYPQAKRIAELLCSSFANEKNTPIKIGRLCMIYGPGMPRSDKRVLNYFLNQILEGEPITLQTAGKSKASVLYTRDAIEGIFHLLFSNRNGEAFNLANPTNYFSIYEMASIAASVGNISVKLAETNTQLTAQYRSDNFLNLNISKMSELGWTPEVDLKTIFMRTAVSYSD